MCYQYKPKGIRKTGDVMVGDVILAKNLTEKQYAEFIEEATDEATKKGMTLEKYLEDLAEFTKTRTKPSKRPNLNAKPIGSRTKISKKADIQTKTSLEIENETADILAKNGFIVEQNPNIIETTKKPDYLIEGKVFDCYAPFESNKKVRGIWSEVEDKILKEQTKRVIINLKNWKGDLSILKKQFTDWNINGLEEVIYITKEGQINYLTLK